MAGIINWFSFVSKEQREQHEQDYFKKMFPMGEEQKIREAMLLKACILTELQPSEKLYQLQVVKEAFRQPDEKRKMAALKKWYQAPLADKLSPQERSMLLALAELEQNCSTLEEMPEPEEIRQKSVILLQEVIPTLMPDRTGIRRLLQK